MISKAPHDRAARHDDATPSRRRPSAPAVDYTKANSIWHRLATHVTVPALQTKPLVGATDDAFEKEADRVADQLVGTNPPVVSETASANKNGKGRLRSRDATATPVSSLRSFVPLWPKDLMNGTPGEIPADEHEADDVASSIHNELSLQSTSARSPNDQSFVSTDYDSQLGRGECLSVTERNLFEPQFGRDLSQVRIHRDRRADDAAMIYGAEAFTLGNRIAFRHGLYDSQSARGRRLLSHELTHTVQQSGGSQTQHGRISAAPKGIARQQNTETWADVHQRVRKGMVSLVQQHPADGEARLDGLAQLLGTVPREQVTRLYHRLEPGKKPDDFAQYFKDKFPRSRADGLGYLRARMPVGEKTKVGANTAPAVSVADIGRDIAEASKTLPSNQSGNPFMKFGKAMSGEGYVMNPRYWEVEYKLEKNKKYLSFIATPGKSSAWKQTKEIFDKDKTWHNSKLDISMSIGKFGAAAAIKDVYNPVSASKYAVDCLTAATLLQLRGFYLSYPAEHRDADFDRDFGNFVIDRFDQSRGKKDKSSLDRNLVITLLEKPVKLKDYKKVGLRPGDEVPIYNPYMTEPVWRTENSIYLGGDKFFGHPFGVVDVNEYAGKLANMLNRAKSYADRVQYVLDNSTIQSYSRPQGRRARDQKN